MAIPVIAIVGRPNVGKSTLFNCLTRTRDALVADMPGLTRDRIYGQCTLNGQHFILIDTGGIDFEDGNFTGLTLEQTRHAMKEADVILFMVDARAGLTAADQTIAAQIRTLQKPVYLVANKIDGIDPNLALAEFFSLGLAAPIAIAAAHGRGLNSLINNITSEFAQGTEQENPEEYPGIKVAIIGRPNVGKSTLVNRVFGEERVIVSSEAGTTRDSIYVPFQREGKDYVFIDTAGVRRRSRIVDIVEKFSIVKTLQAIEAAQVVVLLIDARENISDQDLKLLGFVIEAGKAIVIAVNKWDDLDSSYKTRVKHELSRRLVFADFISIYFISALHGTGVGDIFSAIEIAYKAATRALTTHQVTAVLQKAIAAHQPPLSRGHRIKLRYAHQGGRNPPVIVIHGTQTQALPGSYQQYLANYFRRAFKLWGTPIAIRFKNSSNPYDPKAVEAKKVADARKVKHIEIKKNKDKRSPSKKNSRG